ncbi:MAG: hypothetical protein NC313_15185 [Butyrivibrio sp.]|nr:hypothetical protein [Butyrivibrio sp.]
MGEVSEKAFPFDSDVDSLGNYDREYFADDFARYFRSFISSGTFMEVADNLQIIANGDMTVTLKPGSMIIDGYKYDNAADIIIPIEPADGVVNRIDRISITWIYEERDAHKTVQKGTPSYVPVPPECRRNAEYKDYVLADISIPAGAIKITQDMITDQRLNSEVCGLAIAFSSIDTTMIFNQLQAFYQKVVDENGEWKQALQTFYDNVVAESGKWQQDKREDFEMWVESIKNTLASVENGELLLKLNQMLESMRVASDRDIDAIIDGSYEGSDEGNILEIASDEDIDAIINGTYTAADEDSDNEIVLETIESEITKVVNKALT